jgi:hypothetical protein
MKLQLPVSTLAEQPPPRGSLTCTSPLGVPEKDDTLKITVISTPGSEGDGAMEVIVVEVAAGGGGGAGSTWMS